MVRIISLGACPRRRITWFVHSATERRGGSHGRGRRQGRRGRCPGGVTRGWEVRAHNPVPRGRAGPVRSLPGRTGPEHGERPGVRGFHREPDRDQAGRAAGTGQGQGCEGGSPAGGADGGSAGRPGGRRRQVGDLGEGRLSGQVPSAQRRLCCLVPRTRQRRGDRGHEGQGGQPVPGLPGRGGRRGSGRPRRAGRVGFSAAPTRAAPKDHRDRTVIPGGLPGFPGRCGPDPAEPGRPAAAAPAPAPRVRTAPVDR